MNNLYFPHPLSKIMYERGLKSESKKFWDYIDPCSSEDDPAHGFYGHWELVDYKTDIPAYTIFSILLPENAKKWWGEEMITDEMGGDHYGETWFQYHSHQYLDLIQSGADIEALEKYLLNK